MHHLTSHDITTLTAQLEDERRTLEEDLAAHGKKVGSDWQGTAAGFDQEEPDTVDEADKMEELATNVPLVETLEKRLSEVNDALARIAEGTYGIDEKTGEPIVVERLFANPAARTNV